MIPAITFSPTALSILCPIALGFLYLGYECVGAILYATRKGNDPLAIWEYLGRLVVVRHIRAAFFSFLLRNANPYSHSIPFRLMRLERGLCEGTMKGVPSVRNPFQSVHAAALVLFGETVCGLAVFSVLKQKDSARRREDATNSGSMDRAIVSGLSIVYHKKARGVLRAVCQVERPQASGPWKVPVRLFDASGDEVALMTVDWTVEIDVKSK